MNFSTTASDFTTLKNGIDTRLEIIQHIETGFYNITKTAKLVNDLKLSENEAGRIPPASSKEARKWINNDTTQELIQECLNQKNLNLFIMNSRLELQKSLQGLMLDDGFISEDDLDVLK